MKAAGNVAQAQNLIDYMHISIWAMKAGGQKTALPDIVCNFAFSSMCCSFFGQLLRCAAQTHSTLYITLLIRKNSQTLYVLPLLASINDDRLYHGKALV